MRVPNIEGKGKEAGRDQRRERQWAVAGRVTGVLLSREGKKEGGREEEGEGELKSLRVAQNFPAFRHYFFSV